MDLAYLTKCPYCGKGETCSNDIPGACIQCGMRHKEEFYKGVHMDENQLELIPKPKADEKPAKAKVPHLTLASVESSNIRSIGYCLETQTLGVKFLDGAVYMYFGVPPEVWYDFRDADSKGAHLSRHVRNVYASTRIVDET